MRHAPLVLAALATAACGSGAASPSTMCNRLIDCITKVAPAGAAAAVQSYGPSSPCWQNDSTAAACNASCQQAYASAYASQCGCTQDSDCGSGNSCDLTHSQCIVACTPASPTSCAAGQSCDAHTNKCATLTNCATDAECHGFPCVPGYGCMLNCADSAGLPSDALCPMGSHCQPDYTCAP